MNEAPGNRQGRISVDDPDFQTPSLGTTMSRPLLWLSASFIGSMVLLITADVLARSIFNYPLRGVPELIAVIIPAIVFLALGH